MQKATIVSRGVVCGAGFVDGGAMQTVDGADAFQVSDFSPYLRWASRIVQGFIPCVGGWSVVLDGWTVRQRAHSDSGNGTTWLCCVVKFGNQLFGKAAGPLQCVFLGMFCSQQLVRR